jgi:predicted nuclease of restriction endonuclease-like (RecB) superfamily
MKRTKEDALAKSEERGFAEIVRLIQTSRHQALQAVNTALIDLYWQVGEVISKRIEAAEWGVGVVPQLAAYIARTQPGLQGFTRPNLFRMKRFYETYRDEPIVSPLVRQLPWTHNLLILGQSKSPEEREFYLRLAIKAHWSKRELERQLKSSSFERTMLADLKLATPLRVLPQEATGVFKDSYLVDFLDLPDKHSEADLQAGLLRNLRKFLMELGDGFAFVGEKVRVQVGNQDFELDLLFYHRDLQCLVAFELKTGRFEPEHMGKLAFYLEALDRDRKRPHENPSIGVLLCRTKDDEVVEYAMNRHLSPALVAQYETQMIPKTVLQQKLHEWSQMLQAPESSDEDEL